MTKIWDQSDEGPQTIFVDKSSIQSKNYVQTL